MVTRLAEPIRHSFTREDWYALAGTGVLADDYRGELMEGEIIDMPPIGSEHGGCVKWLAGFFHARLGNSAVISVQDPIRLGDFSEPQPDIAIVRPRDDFYRHGHPIPTDILLLIEVADTSLHYDRTVKGPLYARYGIPEYWLVDLIARRLERYLTPTAMSYIHNSRHLPGESVSPGFAAQPGMPNLVVPVSGILG